MRAAGLAVALATVTGCGGPELLIDATPPVLIPNGGSAQAGQVEGPTAIPLTGNGAIAAPREEPAPVATPAPQPPTVMDLAAMEANGADALDDAEPDDQVAAADDDSDDHRSSDGEDEGAADPDPADVRTAAVEPPDSSAAAASRGTLAPAVRTIGGPGYSLAVHADWEDLDPTGLGSFLITSANRSMDPGDGFYTNVIVSAEPFAGDTPSYATLNVPSLLEVGALLRDSRTVAPTKRDRGYVDVEAYWINVTGAPYITLQRYVTTGAVGYVVTCAAAASAFESEREVCLDVLDSFRAE